MAAPSQQFLSTHPLFAKAYATGDSALWRRFLIQHPTISAEFQRDQTRTATAAAVPGAAAPGVPQASAPPPTPIGETDAGKSAKASLTDTITSFGLPPALADWAWTEYLNGTPMSQIMIDVRSRPEYAARFPGMAELSKQGRAISESQYIDLERGYQSQLHAYGIVLPSSPDTFAKLITGNVSPAEFDQRLQYREQVAMQSPEGQALRDNLSRLYGLSNAQGLTTSYFIDPDVSSEVIKQQFQAGQAAAYAQSTGFGQLSLAQAQMVGDSGLSAAAEQQTFNQLALLKPLTQDLPGMAPDSVSTDDLLAAGVTQDAAAQKRVKRIQQTRVGEFGGGGSYASGQSGVTGLGSAQ